jgi:alpha-galactosidase
MLLLNWSGEPAETSSQFRRLLLKHYVPRWHGQPPLPALYCNTCFSRGGSGWWLNQCNAENQIALIRAMKPLGIEAVITDAGWFKGEWPNGAGNWDPDPAKYPQGMAPVAAAARQCGGIYGLWFEVERAVLGTPVARQHPEWLLSHPQGGWKLVNFGLRDVRAHFSNMLDAYLRLPGFHVYRQDCNIPTLPYWRAADLPDRQGITEMKYIAGLYDYWDAIRQKYPEAFLEECSGAGPRTDLETVMRFRTHQISECYDNNTATQGALMGIGQYLPNGVVMTPLFRLDDYSFHSAMASALCLGWPAEDPKFDTTRARLLCERYRQVRRLFNKDWYPLTPYSLDPSAWLGVQFNAPEDHEGVILVFRREQSPQPELRVSLRGVDPKSSYELTWQCTGRKETVQGASLRDGYLIRLPEKRSSALILYRKTTSDAS